MILLFQETFFLLLRRIASARDGSEIRFCEFSGSFERFSGALPRFLLQK